MKKKLVVLSGAGVSAESGISTFRDAGGLWEGYDIREVASPEGWQKNRTLVQKFYNLRRRELLKVKPNEAHRLLAQLEKAFEVVIITQNIDDLHERAGSSHVIHLHGELLKMRSEKDPLTLYDISEDIPADATAKDGSYLRPHVVWFGEEVPMMATAYAQVAQADIFLVIGTSLVVYPAAGLIYNLPQGIPKYLIDPNPTEEASFFGFEVLPMKAVEGMKKLTQMLQHRQ